MSAMDGRSCSTVRNSLWRYIDRELSAGELARVSAHLKSCAECARLYEGSAREAKLYRLAFAHSPFGEGFVERMRGRLASELPPDASRAPAGAGEPSGRRLISPRDLVRRRFLGRLSLAAAVLVMAACVVFGLWPSPSVGEITAVAGNVEMVRARRAPSRPDSRLLAGDKLVLSSPDSQARLALPDGTRIELAGPAEFRVEAESTRGGRFIGYLETGILSAVVQHRDDDHALSIRTPDAIARVVGTRFTIDVGAPGTTLKVQEGKVLFSTDDGKVFLVDPSLKEGMLAKAGAGGPVPLAPPPIEPAPAAEDGPETPAAAPAAPAQPRPRPPSPDATGLDQPAIAPELPPVDDAGEPPGER